MAGGSFKLGCLFLCLSVSFMPSLVPGNGRRRLLFLSFLPGPAVTGVLGRV